MAQARQSGCFVALVTLVAVGSLAVVVLGMGVGGWYWWSSQTPEGTLVQGGPWPLTVENPNRVPVSISCALESTPPVEVKALGSGKLSITTLPATCTGTTPNGDKVLAFEATDPPERATGWRVTASTEALPVPPGEAEEEEEDAPEAAAAPRPAAAAQAAAPPDAATRTSAKATPKAAPAPKKDTPAKAAAPAPAPAPAKTAPLLFRYPAGPKFAEIEVSVDGREVGTHPSGTTVSVGTHSVQFYKADLLNISCPIDVDADGRVISLSRKLSCPPPTE